MKSNSKRTEAESSTSLMPCCVVMVLWVVLTSGVYFYNVGHGATQGEALMWAIVAFLAFKPMVIIVGVVTGLLHVLRSILKGRSHDCQGGNQTQDQ